MSDITAGKKSSAQHAVAPVCENCEYYDYNDETDQNECTVGVDMDQDEITSYLGFGSGKCPYFKFYDEYKSVQKQN